MPPTATTPPEGLLSTGAWFACINNYPPGNGDLAQIGRIETRETLREIREHNLFVHLELRKQRLEAEGAMRRAKALEKSARKVLYRMGCGLRIDRDSQSSARLLELGYRAPGTSDLTPLGRRVFEAMRKNLLNY